MIRKGLLLTIAGRALRALVSPEGARRGAQSKVEALIEGLKAESRRLQGVPDRVQFIQRAIGSMFAGVAAVTVPVALMGLAGRSVVEKRLRAWGMDSAMLDPVGRAIPHNPTTEMDLALWRVSRALKSAGAEPRADHPAVQAWLEQYGHRAVREIDIGIPRWREEPDHILHVLSAFMEQGPAATDPEQHFRKGEAAAAEAVAAITAAVRRQKGALAAALVGLLLCRFRQLSGVREWHKFYVVHVMGLVRDVLKEAGADLVAGGRLDQAGDIFYLDPADLTSDRDLRELAARNRADYARDLKRRQVPLAMTSEGEISLGVPPGKDGMLVGTGASAGVHEGVVRVILNPAGARLEPGEILVAPGTDPAWTPLFLTAGALVTETGGMVSHGSVVAREYGIPAVVGVTEATTRLRTGQRVRVDGSTGSVTPLG